jgi:hypothetical protein
MPIRNKAHHIFLQLSIIAIILSLSQSLTIKMSHQFVTNKMCPFAQKAWIALEGKGEQGIQSKQRYILTFDLLILTLSSFFTLLHSIIHCYFI